MARPVLFVVLPVLALLAALLGERVHARQELADDPLPGVVVETLGRGSLGGEDGDDLVLLRVTIEPGASIPASNSPRAALIVLEEGRVAAELDGGEANLTLAGGNGTVPLAPGDETTLAPGTRFPPVKVHVLCWTMLVMARLLSSTPRFPRPTLRSSPRRHRTMPPGRSVLKPSLARRE